MILECPECRTRYLVPDSAIGTTGRTVRCASCRHSWFQDAPRELAPTSAVAPVAPAEAFAPPPPAAAPDRDYPDAMAGEPAFADGVAAPSPPFRARRNPAKLWTLAAIVAGVLMLAAIGAILYTGAPGLAQQLGLPIGPARTPLQLVDDPIQRRELPNGSELFAVSGKVINPSNSRQRVPDIQADLRDAQGRKVFSWTITPQQRSLGPRSAIGFDSAKLDVPDNSKRLELSFVGEAAH